MKRRPLLATPLLAILLLGLAATAVAQPPAGRQEPPAARQDKAGTEASYRIGPRDQVLIRVVEMPELTKEYEVEEDGTIELPVIGQVDARGDTEAQLARKVRDQLLSEGLRRATVSVRVTGFKSRPVSVLGAVAQPGNQFVPRQSTLLEVLLSVGGLSPENSGRVEVRRRAANGLADQVEIQLKDLLELGDPAVNIPIFGGDVIFVPAARQIRVSFLGEVKNPGVQTFNANKPVQLLTAIATVGGLTENAAKKILVRRRQGGEVTEIVVHYRRVLEGRDQDLELLDGDLVIVKESFF